MILVLVGASRPFDRFVKEVDAISKRRKNINFLIQIGDTRYEPKYCEYFRYMPQDQILDLIKKSELVICHGGFGSIFEPLLEGKPVIAVPRKSELGEHIRGQVELVRFFEDKNYIKGVYNICDLEKAIDEVNRLTSSIMPTNFISNAVMAFLKQSFPDLDKDDIE